MSPIPFFFIVLVCEGNMLRKSSSFKTYCLGTGFNLGVLWLSTVILHVVLVGKCKGKPSPGLQLPLH